MPYLKELANTTIAAVGLALLLLGPAWALDKGSADWRLTAAFLLIVIAAPLLVVAAYKCLLAAIYAVCPAWLRTALFIER